MRLLFMLVSVSLCVAPAQKFLADDPLELELKPVTVKEAARRKLSDYYDAVSHTIATPGDLNRRHAERIRAQAVNTLGEPLQGAWWVKRHYYRPMSIDELIAGPGSGHPPSQDGWTVVGAKHEGVSPGFVIIDANKQFYFVKFDPLTNPEMATGADHISSRLLHALGYHVPENYVIEFPAERLIVGSDATVADRLGRRRRMTKRDVADMLRGVPKTSSGMYRATASRAIPGVGIGPYRYYGRRRDDPNDFVLHEHRRDLRGLAVISAWIGHDDSRAINTYDSLVEESGLRFVRHYILDLGSTLGSGTTGPNSPRSGGEYLFGWKQSATQFLSVGLAVPSWSRARFVTIPSVGRFDDKTFDPEKWVPEYPNPAFLNRLPDDEFWAAKQIMAFSDDEIRAIVRSARYSDPRAEAWIAECLIQRRNKIGRAYYKKVLPLDGFQVRGGQLTFTDLAEKAGFGGGGPYAIEWLKFDNTTDSLTPIRASTGPSVPPHDAGYLVARIRSATRPRQTVEVAIRFSDGVPVAVTGIDREW